MKQHSTQYNMYNKCFCFQFDEMDIGQFAVAKE